MVSAPWKCLYDSTLQTYPRNYLLMSGAARQAIRLRLLILRMSVEPNDVTERDALLLADADLDTLTITFLRYARDRKHILGAPRKA